MSIEIKEMTEEDIQDLLLEEEMIAKLCGFETVDEMYQFKMEACEGMIRFGGGFTQPLGYALAHADSKNSAKILRTFRSMCEEHAALHRKFMATRNQPDTKDSEENQ